MCKKINQPLDAFINNTWIVTHKLIANHLFCKNINRQPNYINKFCVKCLDCWAQLNSREARQPAMSHLRLGHWELFLEGVSLAVRLLQFGLSESKGLLGLTQGLHQLVPLVEHVHHELLKVGVVAGVVGVAVVRPVLRYRRHHVAHHDDVSLVAFSLWKNQSSIGLGEDVAHEVDCLNIRQAVQKRPLVFHYIRNRLNIACVVIAVANNFTSIIWIIIWMTLEHNIFINNLCTFNMFNQMLYFLMQQ